MGCLNNQSQEKLPYIQTYISAIGCLRKKTENLYIRPCLSNVREIFYIAFQNGIYQKQLVLVKVKGNLK